MLTKIIFANLMEICKLKSYQKSSGAHDLLYHDVEYTFLQSFVTLVSLVNNTC